MRLRVVSLALVIALIPVFAYAQTPTPIARYDASTGLLPHEFNPNWVQNTTGSPSISIVNGQLIVGSTDTSTDNVFWQWDSPGFQSGQGWAFIIRGGRTSNLGDISGEPAVMEVSHIIGSGTDPDGFTEALSLGRATAGGTNNDSLRLLRRGRGPTCALTVTDVTHEYWYTQTTELKDGWGTLGGNGFLYVDEELCVPTGAGLYGIANDYARFGIFDVGVAGRNEYVIESVEVYGALVQPPTPIPPTPYPCAPLVNCSFEDNGGSTDGWSQDLADPGKGVSIDSLFPNPGGAVDGSHWASWSHGGGAVGSLYQTVSVTPLETYTLEGSFFLGGTGSPTSGTAQIGWIDGGTYTPGALQVLGEVTSIDGEFIPWVRIGGLFTPTQPQIVVVVSLESTGWSSGINFDLVTVGPEATPTPQPPPSTSVENWEVNR